MCPLPVDDRKSEYVVCCRQVLCTACSREHVVNSAERGVSVDVWTQCVFCGEPRSAGTEFIARLRANAARGGATAYFQLATSYEHGLSGLRKDYVPQGGRALPPRRVAWRLLAQAARNGMIGSLSQLGIMKFKAVMNN